MIDKGLETMIGQLNASLIELGKIRKTHDDALNKMINNLPGDKKREALALLRKAKTGKINIAEIMRFTGKISKKDENQIKTNLKKTNDLNK